MIFSGLTVAAAMAAMTLLPQRFLYSVAAGGAIVALFAAFGALLLVPRCSPCLASGSTPSRCGAVRPSPTSREAGTGWPAA